MRKATAFPLWSDTDNVIVVVIVGILQLTAGVSVTSRR